MGRVPQPLHAVVGRDFLRGQDQIRHCDAPGRLANADNLRQNLCRLQEVMEAVPRQHHVELVRLERESGHIPDVPFHVRQAQLGLEGDRVLDHGGGQVDPSDLTGHPSRGTRDGTGPARDIEHLISGSNLGHPDEQLSRFFVAGELREVDSLPAELIDDLPGVLIHMVHSRQQLTARGQAFSLSFL